MLFEHLNAISRGYRHLHRYREIGRVILKHGPELLRSMGWRRFVLWGKAPEESGPELRQMRYEHIRLALEELGPAFVKFGQLLSTRQDVLSPGLISELEKLQDAVPAFAGTDAVLAIEKSLGRPLAALFRTFNLTPLASASIGQVHEAVSMAGDRVVVKVRRPAIEQLIETDLDIMLSRPQPLEWLLAGTIATDVQGLIREFARVVRQELDFEAEAAHIERFAHNFSKNAAVRVPRVYRDLCARDVLTMEFVDGIKVSKIDELDARGFDRQLIATRGAQSVFEQIVVHGFFHADPHPGNLLVLPGNIICFLDYGMMGSLSARQREHLSDLLLGFATRDEHRITDAVFHLSGYNHYEHTARIEADIHTLLESHFYRPLKDIHIGPVFNEMARLLRLYDIRLPSEFFLLTKALVTLEGVSRVLAPAFDLLHEAEPFARRMFAERFSIRRLSGQLATVAWDLQSFAQDLPNELREILTLFKHGDVRFKLEHRNLEGLIRSLDQVSNRIAFAIVLAALLIGSALIVHSGIPPKWHGVPLIGIGGFGVSGIMGFSLLCSILKHGKM